MRIRREPGRSESGGAEAAARARQGSGVVRGRWLAATVAGVAMLAGMLGLGASTATAQAALPYFAYGIGLRGGQVVEALADGVLAGRATADPRGRWTMLIEPGRVNEGDVIAFTVDGVATGRSVKFQSGRFPAPPGIALAPSVAATEPSQAATARPSATPRPTATPRTTTTPRPKGACTSNGRAVPCTPATLQPLPRR